MNPPGFVNYKKWCTRLAAASDKVYQLLAHGRWFSPRTPASSTTKTCRHDISEILLKVALSTINQIIKFNQILQWQYQTLSLSMSLVRNGKENVEKIRIKKTFVVSLIMYTCISLIA